MCGQDIRWSSQSRRCRREEEEVSRARSIGQADAGTALKLYVVYTNAIASAPCSITLTIGVEDTIVLKLLTNLSFANP